MASKGLSWCVLSPGAVGQIYIIQYSLPDYSKVTLEGYQGTVRAGATLGGYQGTVRAGATLGGYEGTVRAGAGKQVWEKPGKREAEGN